MSTTGAKRDPDRTREMLLEAAFEEIYRQGFRAASLDNILKRTGVTKGALYHHFPNKNAMGYAVVDEIVFPRAELNWAKLKDPATPPIEAMLGFIRGEVEGASQDRISRGCPINNLVQEMASIDETFRERLHRIQSAWRAALEIALKRGQQQGEVRQEIDVEQTAAFLVASYEGCIGLAKCGQCKETFRACMAAMANYVESLQIAQTS